MFGSSRVNLVLFFFCFGSLATARETTPAVHFTLIQVNDVYELAGLRNGKAGGLPRLATLKTWESQMRPTDVVLAGDFLSPSYIGSLRVNGRPLAGRHMVDVGNGIIDYGIFGNHDLELPWEDIVSRVDESEFYWIASNLRNQTRRNIPGTRRFVIRRFHGEEAEVRIAFIGLTLDSARPSFLEFTDPVAAAAEMAKELEGKADKIIAITHLPLEIDQQIARQVPAIEMILGGHEHEHTRRYAGKDRTMIYKADSNALTAWVHRLAYFPETGELKHHADLVPLDERIPEHPEVAKKVAGWVNLAETTIRNMGFNPHERVAVLPHDWEGSSKIVRQRSTELTQDLLSALKWEVPNAEVAFFQAGTIRIDDRISAGEITVYDLFRVLPYPWTIVELEIEGRFLAKILDHGQKNRGTGGFLHVAGATKHPITSEWLVGRELLNPRKVYRVVTTDFLASGQESSLQFFFAGNPGIAKVAAHRVSYSALIDYLRSNCDFEIARNE